MHRILIGSGAIKWWYPDFPREPKDTDYIITNQTYNTKVNIVGDNKTELLLNPIIWNLYKDKFNKEAAISTIVLSPEHLLTLKASHLCWDLNWEKHMYDTQWLLKKGLKIDLELFWQLYNYWNEYHSQNKRSDLKMSKNEFFTNAINYDTLEHDEMHKILNPIPIYTKVLKDNCEVELDENKFNSLSFEDKLEFVREEVMVMAWERYKSLGFQKAYNRMFKKFILSHAPLFSLIFIIENYIELSKPKFNFIKTIENGIKEKSTI